MNRTVFSLPAQSDYATASGLAVARSIEHFTGGSRLDDLIELLDRRRGARPLRKLRPRLRRSAAPARSDRSELLHRGTQPARRGAGCVPRRHPERALRCRHRKDCAPARRAHRAWRRTGRGRPAHPPRRHDVAGAGADGGLRIAGRSDAGPVRRVCLRPRVPDGRPGAEARARGRSARHRALCARSPAGL